VLSEEPALNGMPREADPARRALYTLVPTFEEAERSYNAARRGELPDYLWVDCVIPSNVDPSLAPPGQHILTTFVQYVPYELKGVRAGSDPALTPSGGWDANREILGDRVLAQIERYAPNVRRAVIARDVLTPLDLERRFSLTEGNIFHGDPSLEQMFFMRPLPGWAHYRTPIHGLYLCGAGTHPGGGVTGAPGHNAAHVMLADAKKKRW
jgi:phytoene dehydrogenase-like protein